jgi:hypothetical protein
MGQTGRVEVLLTPGICLRVGDHSTVQMISPGPANLHSENNVRVNTGGAGVQLLRLGLCDFDADRGLIRVLDALAIVQDGWAAGAAEKRAPAQSEGGPLGAPQVRTGGMVRRRIGLVAGPVVRRRMVLGSVV